jgi:hypothetical protein
VGSTAAGAQDAPEAGWVEGERLRLRLTLTDAPYNVAEGWRAPSMRQAVDVTADFYELGHEGLDLLAEWVAGDRRWLEELIGWSGTVAFDLAVNALPFSQGWMHEEFHRAVLGWRGFGSKNGVYDAFLGKSFAAEGTISVYGVKDEDLAALKARHPAESVRLQSAGDESYSLLAHRLESDQFFFGAQDCGAAPLCFSERRHGGLLWLLWAQHALYIATITSGEFDPLIDDANEAEVDPNERDFTGPDFAGWVYDLHRPDEPYSGRGVHPTGVGVDRYRKWSGLTQEEQDFLSLQLALHFLNLANPALISLTSLSLGDGAYLGARLSHDLTPFGYDAGGVVWYKQGDWRWAFHLHTYTNDALTLPGLEAELVDWPWSWGALSLELTPRLALWLQPEAQGFRADTPIPGGLLSLQAAFPLGQGLRAWVEAEGKTQGWVQGVEPLDAALSARLGAEWAWE